MYLVKTPKFIQGLFPNYVWRVPNQKKVLYLTFDDGPNENITPWVLDQLAQFNAKATFFCVGKQIDSNPEIYQKVKSSGHCVANHSSSAVLGARISRLPLDCIADTKPEFSICSSRRAARL